MFENKPVDKEKKNNKFEIGAIQRLLSTQGFLL